MTIVLTPAAEHQVAVHDGLWMSPVDAERVTGWTLKPEGMCRADLCVPLPASALRPNEVDLAAFWTKLGGPVIASDRHDVWALGAPAGERNAQLEGLEAPDLSGDTHVGHIATACALGYLDLRFAGFWRERHPQLVAWLDDFNARTPAYAATAPHG